VSAKAQLQELYDEVTAREDRLHELQRECDAAPQRGQREHAELLDYERSLGEGAEPDPELADKLTSAWQEARAGLEAKPAPVPHGGGVFDLVQVWVDPRLEARREGAEIALDAARGAVSSFIHQHLGDLAVEDAEEAAALQREGREAVAAMVGVANRIERKRQWWTRIGTSAGLDHLVHEIPENVLGQLLGGGTPDVPMPLPEGFTT
jgi:hypothetical protein